MTRTLPRLFKCTEYRGERKDTRCFVLAAFGGFAAAFRFGGMTVFHNGLCALLRRTTKV